MTEEVAVLGGGPMGLAVAYELLANDMKPVIFEADSRLGGMTACFDFSGTMVERYYHFHCTSDTGFISLLDELGIGDRMRWTETRMGYWYLDRLQPWGNPVALLKFRGLSIVAKLRYGLHSFLSTKRNNWEKLDKNEASAWIRRWVGEEAYEKLWRRLFDYKFHQFSSNLSAAWIWSRIRRIGRSRYSLMREKLGYLEGGSQTLIDALEAAILGGGGEINLATPVSKVVIENGAVVGVETSTGTRSFGKVISTVPLPFVPRLAPDLPPEVISQYKSINNIAVVCVIFKLRKQLSDYFWLNTNDEAMDIPGLIEYTNLRPLDCHIIYAPFYIPGEHPDFQQEDKYFIDKVKGYLKRINSDLEETDFLDMRASRYRHAQPICEPGFRSKLPPIALPVEGLWVADTSYYYPEDRGISESVDLGRHIAKMAAT